NRIYNATNIDPTFAKERRVTCPRTGGNTNLAPFDPTPARFDTAYFKNLSMIKMGNIKPLTGNQGQIRVNCRKQEKPLNFELEQVPQSSLLAVSNLKIISLYLHSDISN
ncbi:hypothetical protein Golax_012893, partial [Gossypium laxum]|nr:hypothetical protein [Gossypium laxum]